MPDDENNDGPRPPQGEVEILPRLDEDPDEAVYREARAYSGAWHGLDDDECNTVIAGELMLSQQRRRALTDHLAIAQAVALLQREVMKQSLASSPRGARYNKKWAELAPPQIRRIGKSDRSHLKWLWDNRDAVLDWWDSQAPSSNTPNARDRRDRWSHPLIIRKEYERSAGIAHTPVNDDDDTPRRPDDSARRQRGAAAALDEAVVRLDHTLDRFETTAGDMEQITGRSATVLQYDLTNSEQARESGDNFHEIYGTNTDTELTFAEQVIARVVRALIELHGRDEAETQMAAWQKRLRQQVNAILNEAYRPRQQRTAQPEPDPEPDPPPPPRRRRRRTEQPAAEPEATPEQPAAEPEPQQPAEPKAMVLVAGLPPAEPPPQGDTRYQWLREFGERFGVDIEQRAHAYREMADHFGNTQYPLADDAHKDAEMAWLDDLCRRYGIEVPNRPDAYAAARERFFTHRRLRRGD